MLRIRQAWEHSNAPARTTKAEFLAPLIETWPAKDLPPEISKTAPSDSGEADGLNRLAEVTITLPSQVIAQQQMKNFV